MNRTFKFGDKVRVMSGFYEGCEGFIVKEGWDSYEIEGIKTISSDDNEFGHELYFSVFIFSKDLALIKRG